jgi:zinc/manganese transport system permease protein
MLSPDTISILAPAFMAGALIALVHVPLGIEVLKRGIIFLDLAVAQFAALGMLVFHVHFENHDMAPEAGAIGALIFGLVLAIACALGLHALEKKAGQYQEALIGSAFVFAASLSILIMAGDPHSGEQMKDILAGQVLWTSWQDLSLYGPIFICVALIWGFLKNHRQRLFYILFALTIPFSVKLIGVYLVFASLILPALATAGMRSGRVLKGYLLVVASFIVGLIGSYLWDAPSGPAIVIAMFGLSFLIALTNIMRPKRT